MSGSRVTFVGDAMAAVVAGVIEVRSHIGQPPVIVGGPAVLSRLSTPYRGDHRLASPGVTTGRFTQRNPAPRPFDPPAALPRWGPAAGPAAYAPRSAKAA